MPSHVIVYRSYTFLKMDRFFGQPCIVLRSVRLYILDGNILQGREWTITRSIITTRNSFVFTTAQQYEWLWHQRTSNWHPMKAMILALNRLCRLQYKTITPRLRSLYSICHVTLFTSLMINAIKHWTTALLSLVTLNNVIDRSDFLQVAQLSQRDRAALWVNGGPNINIVFRIQGTLL